jgi:dephospho-CoA kinase
VALDFMQSDYQWLESAILFDSGFQRRVPFARVVCVSAPEDVRVSRIMARDAISRERALEWIHRQMPQDQVEAQSDFVILNDGIVPLEPQVDKLIHQLDSLPPPPAGSKVNNPRS